MGWRGLVRSLGAAARQAERARQRDQRAFMRQQRALAKHVEAVHAEQVVAGHEAFVRQLVTVHARGSPAWDWHRIAHGPPPQEPLYVAQHEHAARRALEAYEPGVTDRMLGRADSKRQALVQQVEHARAHDYAAHQQALAQYQEWQWKADLAQGVVSGELDAYRAALDFLFPVSNIPELAGLQLGTDASWYVEATMQLHPDDDLVPDEYPSQLKSGALSWKKMPAAKYNQLYQDHVCSCVLRIAWELFALLPVSMAFVHVLSEMLNTATGHMEPTPILSAAVARETLLRLNPERIDPSDSMQNFVCNMCFTGRGGFKPVEKLSPANFAPAGCRAPGR